MGRCSTGTHTVIAVQELTLAELVDV